MEQYQLDRLKEFLQEQERHGLRKEHFFTARKKNGDLMYCIIKREGIEVLQAAHKIRAFFDPVTMTREYCCVRGTFTRGEDEVMTFGSACKETSQSYYYAEMAEKRCLARGVLKILKMYDGVLGEDEMNDDFVRA